MQKLLEIRIRKSTVTGFILLSRNVLTFGFRLECCGIKVLGSSNTDSDCEEWVRHYVSQITLHTLSDMRCGGESRGI
jgi:hypothetical protein